MGTGRPRRECRHSEDMAAACADLMLPEETFGALLGAISIAELAQMVAEVLGYDGKVTFDISKPDGTPRRLQDSSQFLQTNSRTPSRCIHQAAACREHGRASGNPAATGWLPRDLWSGRG